MYSSNSSRIHLSYLTYTTLQMADNGIVSRFRGNELHCNECIRVTIGLPEENAKYLELLKATYAELTK